MERITLNVEKRSNAGKGTARSLRRTGHIPAVLYRGGDSMPIKLQSRELINFINSTMGEQVMVNLQFSDGDSRLALMKEYQVDPVRGDLLHTDFYEVSLEEKVKVTISISLMGEPLGVKKEGGILQHILSEIEIECFPDKIPPHIEIDVSGLTVGNTLHVRDIVLPDYVKVLTDPDEAVATVAAPIVEVEAAAPVEEEAVEPELLKKGKKEEAEEE